MKVSEALRIIQNAPPEGEEFQVVLACGFTPLHVELFLKAHLQQAMPRRKVTVSTGLYGNLIGTANRARQDKSNAVALCLEWPDLDPRLGYRNLGGWGPAQEIDTVSQVERSLEQLLPVLAELALESQIALSLPTLPLPPLFYAGEWQYSSADAGLAAAITRFAADLKQKERVSIVNPQRLAEASPPGGRFDLKTELLAGLPYSLGHAAALAHALSRIIAPPPAKKGLITDLDDTLWKGILGEVGVEGVSWELGDHSQIHGLYQQLLEALADQGVLIAVASKNDAALVSKAFERKDLIISRDKIFPLEIHWNAKSGSVAHVLAAWNIGASDVIFVDDSAIELGEVQSVFPEIDCRRFPVDDYAGALGFLRDLRTAFSRERISNEDQLRSASLRKGAEFSSALEQADASEAFMQGLTAEVTVETQAASDPRSLELINKTNQFNMNGRRLDVASWKQAGDQAEAIVWSISYRDKFGPLGTVAVLSGQRNGTYLYLKNWVMSCRAFARRIEHHCLKLLFDRTGVDTIALDFMRTARNGPFCDFLGTIDQAPHAEGEVRISRADFSRSCPTLHHQVHWHD